MRADRTPDVSLRVADSSDLPALADLLGPLHPAGPEVVQTWSRGEPPSLLAVTALVASVGADTVGGALSVSFGDQTPRSFRIAVLEKNRGQGVATRLLDALELEHGSSAVLLGDNRSLAWFNRRGFTSAGTMECREKRLDGAVDDYWDAACEASARSETSIERVRLATPEDWERIRLLLNDTKSGMPNITDPSTPMSEVGYLFTGLAEIVVASHNQQPVGIASVAPSKGEAWYNWYTGVLPGARGLGIARALKLAGFAVAKAGGADSLLTHNLSTNPAMITANEAVGYTHVPAADLHALVR
jgi:GNAT superfamily N-acetyltransferase